jgi:hypothetical protein
MLDIVIHYSYVWNLSQVRQMQMMRIRLRGKWLESPLSKTRSVIIADRESECKVSVYARKDRSLPCPLLCCACACAVLVARMVQCTSRYQIKPDQNAHWDNSSLSRYVGMF